MGCDNEEVEEIENPKWNIFKAVLMLLVGLIIAASFAHPFVDSINNFSTATTIPSFFVAFVVLPFVRSSEAFTAVSYASSKRMRTTSLTLSQVCLSLLNPIYITTNHNRVARWLATLGSENRARLGAPQVKSRQMQNLWWPAVDTFRERD